MMKFLVTLLTGAVVVFLGLIPLFVKRPVVISSLFLLYLYIVLSQSWNILGGYAGQVNLGHAAFFGIGALITRMLWMSGLPFILALLAGGIVSSIFALIIGVPAFRLKGAYFIIGTLILAETVRITVTNILPNVTALPSELLADL